MAKAKIHIHAISGFYWDHSDKPGPRDEHNVFHMVDKHNVTTDEVEEVIEGAPVVLDIPISSGDNPVYGVVGVTAGGRMLEVWGIVFQQPPFAGFWRTITAMDADASAQTRHCKERGARR